MLYYLGMDKFSALADPTRRQIIELLAGRGEMSATEISDQFKMSAPAISQHLKVLREAQVVRMEKRGQQRIYRLDPSAMSEFEVWVQKLAARMEDRFARLDEILEAEKQKGKGKK
jgi:DNA-binding transcriptional ArsR family regulator